MTDPKLLELTVLRKKKKTQDHDRLSVRVDLPIRFSEVDSMGVVWHGNYLKFFEDGREAFGKKYELTYLDVYHNGFFTPLVDLNVEYKQPIQYGQEIAVETDLIDTKAAKILHEYRILDRKTDAILAEGTSTQVFVTTDGELQLTLPRFYLDWKKKWDLSSL